MTPLGVFARGTPSRGTPGGGTPGRHTPGFGMPGIDDRGNSASPEMLRALALLVSRLDGPDDGSVAVRDALRQLMARSRESALLLRLEGDDLLLAGAPVLAETVGGDPRVEALRQRLAARGVGSITVREGAAPGELLTLARWITGSAPDASHGAREQLRTWSVLVEAAASAAGDLATSPVAHALSRFVAARSDTTAVPAVATLMDVLDDAEARGDAAAVEGVAQACMAQLRVVGGGGGRLAIESLLRRLMRPGMLQLLAIRLPASQDSGSLLQLFARSGDTGVECLLAQLLIAEDSVARRAYFDAIVAMDVGASLLYDTLRDPRWFVVRNAAALLGEMGIEQADVELLPLLEHADDRIRIAAARALIRLRTPVALTGLHRTIDDSNAEVRRLAASAYGIAGTLRGRSRPAAGPLSAALDREGDDDVALEMLAALGRLGSSHAVQRLLRIALPASSERVPGERVPPRDPWVRIAAMEALVQARGHAMLPAIEALMGDADAEVAAAASRLRSGVGG